MNIDQQLEILVNEAPKYGVPAEIMENAVSPVLKFFASQHQQTDYFVLRTSDRHWLITTLSNRQQPQITKRVIYGFATHHDASTFQNSVKANIDIISLPITHLLFQLFAVTQVDSIILMDTPNNKTQGIEIKRANLEKMLKQQLQQVKLDLDPKSEKIPHNLA